MPNPDPGLLMSRMSAHHICWEAPAPNDLCKSCGAPAVWLLRCSHCSWSEPVCQECAPHGGA